jgi:hypothetical protein
VVAGATITLTALDTGVVRTTASNGAGIYVFVNVPPATYALKVVKEGFTSASQSEFEVFVDQTATYDFHLAIGTKQDTINDFAYRVHCLCGFSGPCRKPPTPVSTKSRPRLFAAYPEASVRLSS